MYVVIYTVFIEQLKVAIPSSISHLENIGAPNYAEVLQITHILLYNMKTSLLVISPWMLLEKSSYTGKLPSSWLQTEVFRNFNFLMKIQILSLVTILSVVFFLKWQAFFLLFFSLIFEKWLTVQIWGTIYQFISCFSSKTGVPCKQVAILADNLSLECFCSTTALECSRSVSCVLYMCHTECLKSMYSNIGISSSILRETVFPPLSCELMVERNRATVGQVWYCCLDSRSGGSSFTTVVSVPWVKCQHSEKSRKYFSILWKQNACGLPESVLGTLRSPRFTFWELLL